MTPRLRNAVARAICAGLVLALAGCASWPLSAPSLRRLWPAHRPAHRELVGSPAADLSVPEHLRAGTDAYRMIALEWEPVLQSAVAGYAVERASAPDAVFRRVAVLWGRGESVYVDDGAEEPLGDGAAAWYRLRPFDADGHLAAETSPAVAGSTAPLPGPPPALRAFSRQPREVPLAWRPAHSEIASGYVVERSPSADGPWEIVAHTSGRLATSYVDRPLGNLRVLYYRVSTLTPSGTGGPPSDPVRAVTKPEPLPPIGLRLAEAGLGRNVVAWEPNIEPDLAAYRLLRIRDGGAPELVAEVTPDVNQAEDRGLAAGERVTYVAVAIDRDGLKSQPSNRLEVESRDYGITGEGGPQGVSLHWATSPDEFPEARVMRSGWLGSRELGRTREGSFVDPDVAPGRSYRYVVVLMGPDGSEAPPSAPIEVRVPEAGEFR